MVARDLGPGDGDALWKAAQRALRSGRVRIAHIDTGLAPHPGLGFAGDGTPPGNIHMAEGINYHDPSAGQLGPVSTLVRGAGKIAALIEFPDHGIKTLSVILANDKDRLIGAAPGAHVVPYRVANGPVFRYPARTECVGFALDHALGLDRPCRVASISMGNPGPAGFWDAFRLPLRGELGMARTTRAAINRAYEAGMIVVCAAGQLIDGVVTPARYARTIAVGGFAVSGRHYTHYPRLGYADPQHVDVWARAVDINRASAHLKANGEPAFVWADDPEDPAAEVSGTSYACPQVAAAAAMWIETHHDALETAFGRPGQRWRIVEAFRRALRNAADHVQAEDVGAPGKFGPIAALNVEQLLATPPDTVFEHRKRGEA